MLQYTGTELKRGSKLAAGLDLVANENVILYPAWFRFFSINLGLFIVAIGYNHPYLFFKYLTLFIGISTIYIMISRPPPIIKAISTNSYMAIPVNNFGHICERSGLALKGLSVGGGIIDADYRGEIKVILRNSSDMPIRITKGMRIAQIIILPYICVELMRVNKLDDTERGEKGFGSSGLSS